MGDNIRQLNVIGTGCPMNFVLIKTTLDRIPAGELLRVQLDKTSVGFDVAESLEKQRLRGSFNRGESRSYRGSGQEASADSLGAPSAPRTQQTALRLEQEAQGVGKDCF